jgi:ketol-acid reductoisomerase
MKITVVGYGIQGRAQALNLRDSGHEVTIANRKDSYHETASSDGFNVIPIKDSIKDAEIIFLLIPDAVQDEILENIVFPNIAEGATIIFAHGYWLAYEAKNIPENINILMIAPRFPGEQIRQTFISGGGVPAYVDVAQNFTNTADEILKKLTESLGFAKGGLIKLSFKQEAEIDLFIEQFMAPTFFASAEIAYELLVKKGYPKEAACLELYFSGELGAVRTMMSRDGLYKGFQNNASPTCQYGVSSSRKLLWGDDMKEKAEKQLERITSGRFSEELSDHENTSQVLNDFVESDIALDIKDTEERVNKIITKFL